MFEFDIAHSNDNKIATGYERRLLMRNMASINDTLIVTRYFIKKTLPIVPRDLGKSEYNNAKRGPYSAFKLLKQPSERLSPHLRYIESSYPGRSIVVCRGYNNMN